MNLVENLNFDIIMRLPGNNAVRRFEYKIADYCDIKYSIAVCNATTGILGTFYALGLKGKEVITTPLTWSGAFSGLIALDCKMEFCDVEPQRLTLDPSKLESLITEDTKAIFTADFWGYPAFLDKVKSICEKYNLLLIHDAASSFSSKYKGYFSGHFADVTIFSFGTKKVFTTGEGGCIVTNDDAIYQQLLKYITHPERQARELKKMNMFPLNTGINQLGAEYGNENFDRQMEEIEINKIKTNRALKNAGLDDIYGNNCEANFYKTLIPPTVKKVFSEQLDGDIKDLPLSILMPSGNYLNGEDYHNKYGTAYNAVRSYKLFEFLDYNY